MKIFLKFLAVVFVLGTALFIPAQHANAGDSGDEYVVPMIEWNCYGCKWQVFTFDPDDIGGDSKPEHKMTNYQQSNWVNFATGNAIVKCSKSPDGAHFFEKKGARNTSPYIIGQRKDAFIVLKSGSAIKATVIKFTCHVCKLEGFAFKGDDLDQFGQNYDIKLVNNLYNMKSDQKVPVCGKITLIQGDTSTVVARHMLIRTSAGTPSSNNLRGSIANLWYSD